jgi:uncharacterized protein YndB with AHSA1/START domain
VTRISSSTVVNAPAEEVWKVVVDPRNLPRWNRYIRAVHDVPNGELRPGSRYWTELGGFGVRFRVGAEVQEIESPRYARVRLSGPVEAVVRTWIRPIGKRRSRLEHQVDYTVRGGPLGAIVARALRHLGAPGMLRRGTRAQKRQAEEG